MWHKILPGDLYVCLEQGCEDDVIEVSILHLVFLCAATSSLIIFISAFNLLGQSGAADVQEINIEVLSCATGN